ncbi:TIGR00270 family protein, partial [Candidatus Woesearchaeota archaeon]|nr:TIGR00270 family protein [Candidatus Woesearchaeota archaeon]
MADCEMCGLSVGSLVSAKIEGTIMKVCPNCARYGAQLETPSQRVNNFTKSRPKRTFVDPDENKVIVKNYSSLVKNAREKSKLKQEQVAKELNEKESLIHSIESGNLKPSFKTARKLEKFFHIKLIEEIPELQQDSIALGAEEAEPLTM